MNGSFYEQLGGVTGLFEQWGACERTVVACALARRVPWPGLRLVQRAVDAALQEHVADQRQERDANDELYLSTLLAPAPPDGDDEKRLQKLVSLLPLLRTENARAKDAWVAGAGALVQRALDGAAAPRAADLCRQLLALLLVHPALAPADHRTLSQWLRYLESHIAGRAGSGPDSAWCDPAAAAPEPNIWSSGAPFRRTVGKNMFRTLDAAEHFPGTDLQESFSKNGRDVDISLDTERLNFDAAVSQPKSQRSNSLTPPSTNFLHMSSSAENLSDEPFVQKPRSFSLSSEHSLSQIRPLGIMYGTAGSETRLDDLRSHNYAEHPGMANVAQWLKSLRLHKYVWLFTNISYDQMMAIDETYLENLGVTKGARHKILVSIKKLAERGATLAGVERELRAPALSPAALLRALERLRPVLLSPMLPGGELPPRLVAILQLASKCLESAGAASCARAAAAEEEPTPLALHCWLVEKALHHEALGGGALRPALVALRHRLPPRQFFRHVGDMPPHRHHAHARWRQSGQSWSSGKRASGVWATGPAVPRGKSHSYPPYPPPPPAPPLDYAGLDALCLQMTQHAID